MKLKSFFDNFEYPFSFINNEHNNNGNNFNIEDITLTLFNNSFRSEKINFPADIKKVYWYSVGQNDIKPWMFIGKIISKKDTFYVYYIGECDYY